MAIKETYESRMDRQKNHEFELVRSQTTGDPLNGTIVGVIEQRRDDGEKVYCAQVSFGDYQVIIPENLYREGLEDRDRPYVRMVMQSRLGSRVYFVVEQIDEKTRSSIGDAVKANEIRRKFWFKKSDDGEYEMCKGREITGDVVAIRKNALIINVSGVETFMPAKDATWNRVPHLGRIFTPGQSVKIRIIEVFRREDGSVKFVASHKVYEDNPAVRSYDKYVVDSVRMGEVTNLQMIYDKDTGEPSGFKVFVQTEDGVSVQCRPPVGVVPSPGQMMSFILTRKDKNERGVFMFGRGLHCFR